MGKMNRYSAGLQHAYATAQKHA